jgi:PAS domain S-box-containing protein
MSRALRVLYVDDDPGLLEIGKMFLEQTGDFSVETIDSASDALKFLENEKADAIVSDYQMPGMDGIQFLMKIRAKFGSLPFILFTGKGREEVVIQAINNGADFYLQKGGDPDAQFAELSHKVQIAIERTRAADKIQALNRLYSVLSATNKATFNIRTKNEFFNEICRILVEIGGFRMAWIGIAEPESKIIRPVAYTGYTDGYLDSINISTEDVPNGRGPTGTAYREGKFYFSNDITSDPRMEPWRDSALKRGYLANAAFPFALGTKNAGVLSIYAPVTGFFNQQVIDLLNDLAGDISFSLRVIDDQNDRKKAESALRESEEKFHSLYMHMTEGAALHELTYNRQGVPEDYRIIETNQAFESQLGIPRDSVIGKTSREAYGVTEPPYLDIYARVAITGEHEVFETYFPPLDKHFSISVYCPSKGRFATIFEDITRRKRHEEEQVRKSDELSAAYEQIAATEEELRENYNELAAGQKLLQESRQFLQSVVQGSPIPTFVIDREHRIMSWNNALADYLGISADTVMGKPLAGQAFYKTDRPSLADLIVDQAVDEIPKWYEGKFSPSSRIEGAYEVTDFFPSMKGGTWLFFTASPIFDDSGNLIGAVETLQDVTGRLQTLEKLSRANEELSAANEELAATEEELRQNFDEVSKTRSDRLESEERFRSALGNLPGTAWAVDRDLRYTLSQGAGLSLIGLKPDQVVGMTLYEFFGTSDTIHPVISSHLRALSGENVIYDYTHQGISFRTSLSPLHDNQGNIVGVTGLAIDITELTVAEERYRDLLNNIHDIVWQTTTDLRFTYISQAQEKITGFSSEEVLGRSLLDIITNNSAEMVKERLASRLDEAKKGTIGEVTIFDVEAMDKQGNMIWLEVSASPIIGPNRIIQGFRGVAREITERKLAEDALRKANRQLNLLGSITRHDIGNKISVVQGYLKIAQKNSTDRALNEYFEKMESAMKAIQSQIAFTKVYQAIGSREPSWQDLDKTIPRSDIPATVTLKSHVPGIKVYADPMLEKVFSNLLDNSIRHGEHVTEIRVSHRQSGESLIIIWEDNGTGIPAEEKEKIFERGFGKNTGLGLFLVREILALTGISIIETGEPGKGVRFEMTVPKGAFSLHPDTN